MGHGYFTKIAYRIILDIDILIDIYDHYYDGKATSSSYEDNIDKPEYLESKLKHYNEHIELSFDW